jgi:hypothetical protein
MSFNARALILIALTLSGSAWAQGEIYSCTDAKGHRHTSDRLIPECADREHRVLGSDGSVRKVLPPPQTPAQQADAKAKALRDAEDVAARQEMARREAAALRRYPSQVDHEAARKAALELPLQAIKQGEQRLAALKEQRKPLAAEIAEHAGKPLPQDLQQRVNISDAAIRAQGEFLQLRQAEVQRVNASYDAELPQLKKLWATHSTPSGASPGGMVTISR